MKSAIWLGHLKLRFSLECLFSNVFVWFFFFLRINIYKSVSIWRNISFAKSKRLRLSSEMPCERVRSALVNPSTISRAHLPLLAFVTQGKRGEVRETSDIMRISSVSQWPTRGVLPSCCYLFALTACHLSEALCKLRTRDCICIYICRSITDNLGAISFKLILSLCL